MLLLPRRQRIHARDVVQYDFIELIFAAGLILTRKLASSATGSIILPQRRPVRYPRPHYPHWRAFVVAYGGRRTAAYVLIPVFLWATSLSAPVFGKRLLQLSPASSVSARHPFATQLVRTVRKRSMVSALAACQARVGLVTSRGVRLPDSS